jgi:hypothetical protein
MTETIENCNITVLGEEYYNPDLASDNISLPFHLVSILYSLICVTIIGIFLNISDDWTNMKYICLIYCICYCCSCLYNSYKIKNTISNPSGSGNIRPCYDINNNLVS